jgi:hypothetical protein
MNTADMFQKFFHLNPMQAITHIEEDEVYVVHVWANWHITQTNTKLLLQQPPSCLNSFLP